MAKRRDELADALQTCRDLRNKIDEIEFPLQKRIRELEVERDKYATLVQEDSERLARLEQGMHAAQAFISWLLASGKAR